jgi:deoxyhypusine synthase
LRKSLIPSRFRDEKELLAQVKKDLKIDNLNDYGERALLLWAKKKNIDIVCAGYIDNKNS